MSIDAYTDRYLPLLEDELRDALACRDTLSMYYGMMQYHMGWLDSNLDPTEGPQGKRLRPMLCLLTCEAVGGQVEQAAPAAAAIELVHSFTLIHDDIEDGSSIRRRRTTVWKQWGLAHGINAGDGMLTTAFLKLSQLHDRGVPFQRALRAQRILAETCLAITEGQYMDLAFEAEMDVSLDGYLCMIRNKTAALIACSARLGALVGGADREIVEAYARFGENLGLAYQAIDDILGIWGQEERTGKSAFSDILTRKKTLPIVYALADPELRAVYGQKVLTERDVARVVSILERWRAREYAEQIARRHSKQAMRCLEQAGQATPSRRMIRDHALSLLDRAF